MKGRGRRGLEENRGTVEIFVIRRMAGELVQPAIVSSWGDCCSCCGVGYCLGKHGVKVVQATITYLWGGEVIFVVVYVIIILRVDQERHGVCRFGQALAR